MSEEIVNDEIINAPDSVVPMADQPIYPPSEGMHAGRLPAGLADFEPGAGHDPDGPMGEAGNTNSGETGPKIEQSPEAPEEVGETAVESAVRQIPVTAEAEVDDRPPTPEEEVSRRAEAAGGNRYKAIIENLRKLEADSPGTAQLIQQMESKHSELIQKAKEEYESEQAQARAEAERLTAERAERERQRQEKVNQLKIDTIALVAGLVTGEIPTDKYYNPVLEFEIDSDGVVKEDHIERLDELDIYDSEEYSARHEAATTEMSTAQMDELIDVVYAALGAKRPGDETLFAKYKEESRNLYGSISVNHYGGMETEVPGMPNILIYEAWTKSKVIQPEQEGTQDLPLTNRSVQIIVRELEAAAV